jgi:hypothetical protein
MSCVVYRHILGMARSHLVEKGDISSNLICAIYSIIWGIAWWMILRGKPALRQWAIAANAILVFIYVPALLTSGNWRGVLKAELNLWPFIIIGIFGTIVFSVPYRGWRHKSQVAVK